MTIEELSVLLPCHSIEDFPVHHEGDAASGLLVSWTALWHPALIAACGKVPTWHRADAPPQASGRVLIVPEISEPMIMAGYATRAEQEGALVIRHPRDRQAITAKLLSVLETPPTVDDAWVRDFWALGLCFLHTELLTRQMRYSSCLDEGHFQRSVLRAATTCCASTGPDDDQAKASLQACFDVLTEARERYYPVDAYFLDLVLVAEQTLGRALLQELESGAPMTLLMSAQCLEIMASKEPETLAALKAALAAGSVSIAGGELVEGRLALDSQEAFWRNLNAGRQIYQKHLGQTPVVFARRRFGLSPLLPQVLSKAGFIGALHATLDDGQFPTGEQSKLRWEGEGATALDAYARVPLDALRPETVLNFAGKLSTAMDLDHVATVAFARWPGQGHAAFLDLKRVAKYGSVMGRFVHLDDYFRNTVSPGNLKKFAADEYRSPYLKQAIIRNLPIPCGELFKRQEAHRGWSQLETLQTLIAAAAPRKPLAQERTAELPGLADFVKTVEQEPPATLTTDDFQVRAQSLGNQLADVISGKEQANQAGFCLVNTLACSRTELVILPIENLPAPASVLAVQPTADGIACAVELPPLGFRWVAASGPPAVHPQAVKSSKGIPMAEEWVLRNECLEAKISPKTGGLASLRSRQGRENRLGQQLSLRTPGPRGKPGDVWVDPDLTAVYSQMQAEKLEVLAAGPAFGQIVAYGSLIAEDGTPHAHFRQTFTVVRQSPVLQISIELDPLVDPRADPWNAYFACRWAWGDAAAEIYRSVGWTSQHTELRRIEAPHFLEIVSENDRTCLLTSGWPYHRRHEMRMLDTLLATPKTGKLQADFGVGLNLPSVAQSVLALREPVVCVPHQVPAKTAPFGWLLRLDRKNVIATRWSPLEREDGTSGFRVHLLETEGQGGSCLLMACRPIRWAQMVDLQGNSLGELPIYDGQIRVDISGEEWLMLEATF